MYNIFNTALEAACVIRGPRHGITSHHSAMLYLRDIYILYIIR